MSNSLSLLSDAIHNFGDSSAIFIAYLAGRYSRKAPDKNHTYGYKRIEILAGFVNGIVLVAICLFLLYEAYERLLNPEPVKGLIMLVVATFGLLANFISVVVLNKDKNHNINIKAAYLHLLGDTLSSVAVMAGGLAIWLFNIVWVDPLVTASVSIFIIWHSWKLIKESVDILMQSTPPGIDRDNVKLVVESLPAVEDMHHIHIWRLDETKIYLEAHINLKQNVNMEEMMDIRNDIEELLRVRFGINHITLLFGFGCCKNINNEILLNNCAYN